MPLAEYVQEKEIWGCGDCHLESLSAVGVVSLYNVLRFHAGTFIDLLSYVNACEAKLSLEPRSNAVVPEVVVVLYAKMSIFGALCDLHGFVSTTAQCKRLGLLFEKNEMQLSCGELKDWLGELRRRCEDEFKAEMFFHLTPQQATQYDNPLKDWDDIVGRFFKTRHNIQESIKCFSLERYGAAVFHILLVAEYGVVEIAKLVGVAGDRPGWGCLKSLNDILSRSYKNRSQMEQRNSKILEAVVPMATVVKDNWRHKMDHVDNQIVWIDTDFSPNVAEEIIKATRGFMRKLALELPR